MPALFYQPIKMREPYVIAEIAQGYEGEPFLVKKFIQVAKKAEANAVKFQVFHPSELCTSSYKYHSLFEQLYIEPGIWMESIKYANSIGIDIVIDVFGEETLEWVAKSNVKGIKIHTSDIKNHSFIKSVNKTGKVVFLGVGGSQLKEIEKASSLLNNCEQILLLGFQAEPNEMSDIELNKIQLIKRRFNKEVGYADHIRVDSLNKYSVPIMAFVSGATVIEKHLTLEREYAEFEDYVSALNPREFAEMVHLLQEAKGIPDPFNSDFVLSARELVYRKSSKKIILSSRDIAPGTVLTPEHIVYLRTGEESDEILEEAEIIGKKISVPLNKHSIIKRSYLS